VIDEIRSDAETRMRKSLEALRQAFAKIRTGRANTAILQDVMVDYYGTDLPVNQAANVFLEDARTIVISPWEKRMLPEIEKAILKSEIGVTPNTSQDVVRLSMPPLTEEGRRDLSKQARAEAEQARVAIRNIRRDANGHLKELLREKEISEDDERHGEEAIQRLTDRYVNRVDEELERKEAELMEI